MRYLKILVLMFGFALPCLAASKPKTIPAPQLSAASANHSGRYYDFNRARNGDWVITTGATRLGAWGLIQVRKRGEDIFGRDCTSGRALAEEEARRVFADALRYAPPGFAAKR